MKREKLKSNLIKIVSETICFPYRLLQTKLLYPTTKMVSLIIYKIHILSLKCCYGVLWDAQCEISHAPISLYCLGSSGELPVPRDTLMSVRGIPSPLLQSPWAVMSGRGAWLWREMRQLPASSQKESKWKRQVKRHTDSNRHVKILPVKLFRAGNLHTVCSTEEWVCSQILTLLNWDHQHVQENSTTKAWITAHNLSH